MGVPDWQITEKELDALLVENGITPALAPGVDSSVLPRSPAPKRPNIFAARHLRPERLPEGTRAAIEAGLVCANPLRLGVSDRELVHKETGEVEAFEADEFLVPCSNRRRSRCPHCADRYQRDAYHVCMAGLPADEAFTFVTLTAPNMAAKNGKGENYKYCLHHTGDGEKCGCGKTHPERSSMIGAPRDPGRFDYRQAASFNFASGDLWSDFMRAYRRAYVRHETARMIEEFGWSKARAGYYAKRSASRIASLRISQLQARGLIHHHALLHGRHDEAILLEAVEAAGATSDGYRHRYATGHGLDVKVFMPSERSNAHDDPGSKASSYISRYVGESLTADVLAVGGAVGRHYSRITAAVVELEAEREAIDAQARSEAYSKAMRDWWLAGGDDLLPDPPDRCTALLEDGQGERYSKLGLTRCPCSACLGWRFRRRSVEYLGLRGHILTHSQTWPLSFADIRENRRAFARDQSQYEPVEEVKPTYNGQGWPTALVADPNAFERSFGLAMTNGLTARQLKRLAGLSP